MITVKQLKRGVWRDVGVFRQETQSLDQILTLLKSRLKNGKYEANINGFVVAFEK